ncbi:DUF305 domain-containing protein [Candidatus Saccharibacteria bacterium]|nr:DUF305 domain-containing protein [Candidatus Saccharibacteria bacterium]MBI3337699.1 DUF305 domain-containing protein [Candidatus Saccharibacteria bacterium]
MKKTSILYGIIGLLAGIIITGTTAVLAVNNDNHSLMNAMGMDTDHSHQPSANNHGEMPMTAMSAQLQNKSGDDFDKTFIEMMISHHEGAIDMAKLVPARAKHDEIKKLGEAVISAQTKEIIDMKQWQKGWNYDANEAMQMMHGTN